MDRSLKLVEHPELAYKKSEINGIKVIGVPENLDDYFHRSALYFVVEDDFPRSVDRVFLILTYIDTSIGLIQVEFDAERKPDPNIAGDDPAYTQATKSVGDVCIGLGKRRRAIFYLEKPAFKHRQKYGADIRIFGVKALVDIQLSLSLSDEEWNRIREELPTDVDPRLHLSRPMQLVITIGADSKYPEQVEESIEQIRKFAPIAKVLGFNGFESYVKWNFVEKQEGCFDWSYYDKILEEAEKYGLKWFPLLVVGSGYALPDWYYERLENVGFVCLEHEKSTDIPTIFSGDQDRYVERFLEEFGKHYEPTGKLLGVRLGPSGNYGESQYPATGDWGYKWQKHHIHIGWWAGDPFAIVSFRRFLKSKYKEIQQLNRCWESGFNSFDDIKPVIPQFVENERRRKDFVDWYISSMTEWCEKWAIWARKAMPSTEIYQSIGGWGFVESGTDFTEQTKSMAKVSGGVRSTNEDDCYVKNFCMTRMLSSAARFYRVPYGSEPAGFLSARGVVARIYNTIVNNSPHLFFYHSNLLNNDQAIEKWLKFAPLLDMRDDPFIEVAVLYPTTKIRLDTSVLRYINASAFNQYVVALRSYLDFDFCSEQMILDGALSQYKVLIFLSRYQSQDVIEGDVLSIIDNWIKDGGIIIYPYNRRPLRTIEGDYSIYNKWLRGETGNGLVIFYYGDWDPPYRYPEFIREKLKGIQSLHPLTQQMLRTEKPNDVYVSVLKNGSFVILNYSDKVARVFIPSCREIKMEPYSIEIVKGE